MSTSGHQHMKCIVAPIGHIFLSIVDFGASVECFGRTYFKADGSNGTVNLMNRFPRMTNNPATVGGSDDAILLSHNHDFYYVLLGAAGTVRGVANNSGSSFKTSTEGESGTGKNMPAFIELIPYQAVS